MVREISFSYKLSIWSPSSSGSRELMIPSASVSDEIRSGETSSTGVSMVASSNTCCDSPLTSMTSGDSGIGTFGSPGVVFT